jgi:hypothetical protein
MGYEKDLTGKATLAAEDIRFARTIERLQRIIVSELTKMALVHLYAHGYTNEGAANFTLSLTNPSIIYDQERLALFKEKVELAQVAMEASILPRDFIYDKIFHFSEDQYAELEDMIVEDKKRSFRYEQIKEEGNDPAESGQAYGTPHQIASLYGGKESSVLNTPDGYDETKIGRPKSVTSIIGTDKSAFGRDPIGTSELTGRKDSAEDKSGISYKGGSPLALENSMGAYLQNKKMLDGLFKKQSSRKVNLFEQSNLMSEDNIIDGLD